MKEFENKVALVTGGSSGIGRATARAFAREGAKVVIAARRVKESEETIALIYELGSEGVFIKTDVSKASEVENLIDRTIEKYGRIDCAFNNAGMEGPFVSITYYPEEMWERVIDVNLKGTWLCMKYEIPQMLKQRGGTIVNMSSLEGKQGARCLSAYSASKFGVIGLTKTAALEYGSQGIRVNAVCPSLIDTQMLRKRRESADTKLVADIALQELAVTHQAIPRLAQPQEVAESVLWLCSDRSSFVTGEAMLVDGGYRA